MPADPPFSCGQDLLSAIESNSKSPLFNHTLQRTFGTTFHALRGPPLRLESGDCIPTNGRTGDEYEVSDFVRRKVDQLHHRFVVCMDTTHQKGSKDVKLCCELKDQNLPNVPPLLICLDETYPQSSPMCKLNMELYNGSPFLRKLQETLEYEFSLLRGKHSLTHLLNLWEISVWRSCSDTRYY